MKKKEPQVTLQFPEHIPAPFSQEAEEATLGALLNNTGAYFIVSEFLKAEHFFLLRHQYIYAAITRAASGQSGGSDYDYLTVSKELRDHDQLEKIGGVSYLVELAHNTPRTVHAEIYAQIVQRAAARRSVLAALTIGLRHMMDESIAYEEALARVEAAFFEAKGAAPAQYSATLGEALLDVYKDLDNALSGQGDGMGLPLGIKALDTFLMGVQPHEVIEVAGASGMGKSSFVWGAALHAARCTGKGVFGWSGEMRDRQIARRLLSGETGINGMRLRSGKIEAQEMQRVLEGMNRLSNIPLHIDYTPQIDLPRLRARVLALHRETPLALVVVDHIGLMSHPSATREYDAVSENIRGIKALALEINVPFMVAVQLSREVHQTDDKRPRLWHLRASGELEQSADIVLGLYRDEVYNPDTLSPGATEFIVLKARDGGTGSVTAYFDKAITRYLDATEETVSLKKERFEDPGAAAGKRGAVKHWQDEE